jgi:hypothetical protein
MSSASIRLKETLADSRGACVYRGRASRWRSRPGRHSKARWSRARRRNRSWRWTRSRGISSPGSTRITRCSFFRVPFFLEIDDAAGTKRWPRELLPRIASTREVLAHNRSFRALRARQGGDPAGFVATCINIALTFQGLTKLRPAGEIDNFGSDEFRTRSGPRTVRNSCSADYSRMCSASGETWFRWRRQSRRIRISPERRRSALPP